MILVKDIVWFEVIVINTVPVDHREMLGEPATPARCRSSLLALVMAVVIDIIKIHPGFIATRSQLTDKTSVLSVRSGPPQVHFQACLLEIFVGVAPPSTSMA